MAGSRTLKLSILGDVDNLNKSLKTASADVDSFGDKVGQRLSQQQRRRVRMQ